MPTSEELLIIVNGNVVTNMIPVASVRIVRERGKRVSTCSFVIENGASLGLAQWNSVVIYSDDLATVYFNGFIMSQKAQKNGIQLDYSVECSSVEILLQKAIINGSFTGTDGEIITSILANAYPDLSDFFDWSSGITDALLGDITMNFQDMNLMDALDMLSAKAGGVSYGQGYNNSARTNMIHNPNIDASMAFYGGTLPTGSEWLADFPTWDDNNVAWGAGFGDGSGGIRITSQNISGTHRGFLRIGRTGQGDDLPFKIQAPLQLWLSMQVKFKATSAAAVTRDFRMITYDEGGTLYHDGSNSKLNTIGITGAAGAWQSVKMAGDFTWSLVSTSYDETEIPPNGWCEIVLRASSSASFTFDVDEVIIEYLPSESGQPNFPPLTGDFLAYFDGDSTDSYWLGTANASASAQGANPLTWGSNPNASFDLDIDSGTEIFDDFEFNFDGFDSLHSVIVTGGYTWEDVDWIYPNNGNSVSTHFDLEVSVHPAESLTQPIIYKNIGSDGTPNWSAQTVATRQDGFGVGNVLYDLEDHWVEFQDAPPDLELSWRITGRIKKRIRVVVTNEELKDASGIELTDTIHIEGNTTPAEAYDLGQAELARLNADATYKFTTYEPGLNPNDEIDITDSLQSISADTVIIERVTHTYLGGGKSKFAVECGRYSSGFDDIMMETHNLAEHKTPIGQDTTEVTVALLVDQDASILLDQDGNQLLDIS